MIYLYITFPEEYSYEVWELMASIKLELQLERFKRQPFVPGFMERLDEITNECPEVLKHDYYDYLFNAAKILDSRPYSPSSYIINK